MLSDIVYIQRDGEKLVWSSNEGMITNENGERRVILHYAATSISAAVTVSGVVCASQLEMG